MTTAVTLVSVFLTTQLTPKEILDRVDDVYRGTSSHGTMKMSVTTEHWSRELRMEMWSEGTEKTLLRILSPKKEKGTATLMVDKNIWNYMPKVKRVIKLPSSMMGGSWMGSHFTNDDLVKQSRMAEDFTFSISFEGKRDGKKIVEITCIPKEDAAVVWGKLVVEVEEGTWIPLKMLYYDEDLALARTMTFSKVKTFGKRTMPTVVSIKPEDKPNESTVVTYEEINFDIELPAKTFTRKNLER